ncbi:MAG: sigma-54 dependent transcriptional regulator [Bacteroidota bacterium]
MANLQAVKQRFGIIGRSEALDRALSTAVRVSNTDLSVLITGESGVGKEAFSKIIHALSSRKHSNFIAVNCGAIPEGTINSELFGHEKGAFTGATGERKGYFQTVDGGTIFLDEIGEMPLETQAFLLRVLESGEFLRVGSSKVLKTDVRVVAATNVNLFEKVKQGKFREDLYYRLNTVPILVPPLRERREDIYMLFRKFAVDFAEKYRATPVQLDDRAQLMIENYSWPGNIRELRNVVEQISVLSEEKLIDAEGLLRFIPHILNRNLPIPSRQNEKSEFQEREILYKLLFDMKNDLNDLKSLVFDLIQRNDLSVPDIRDMKSLEASVAPSSEYYYPRPKSDYNNGASYSDLDRFQTNSSASTYDEDFNKPIVLPRQKEQHYNEVEEVEEVEESLSLADNEKNLIRKALKKHNGRRKDAATELGISERTLYRKIKEYHIAE